MSVLECCSRWDEHDPDCWTIRMPKLCAELQALRKERDELKAQVEKLKQQMHLTCSNAGKEIYAELEASKAREEKLAEALGFYGNNENYGHYETASCGCCSDWKSSEVEDDKGLKARAALEAWRKERG